jgi:hypothetical protein
MNGVVHRPSSNLYNLLNLFGLFIRSCYQHRMTGARPSCRTQRLRRPRLSGPTTHVVQSTTYDEWLQLEARRTARPE